MALPDPSVFTFVTVVCFGGFLMAAVVVGVSVLLYEAIKRS